MTASLSNLFHSLAPTYFSPSVPIHIPSIFLVHGGHILPPAHDVTIDPLDLPVSYYLVARNDPIIPHLSRRPVVLYDAEWVLACVRAGQTVGLGNWIVPIWSGEGKRQVTCQRKLITNRGGNQRDYNSSIPISRRTSRGPKTPQKRQIATPKLLFDFDEKTSVDLRNGDAVDVLAKLAEMQAPFPNEQDHPAAIIDVESMTSKRKARPFDQNHTENTEPFCPEARSPHTAQHQGKTARYRIKNNQSRSGKIYPSLPPLSNQASLAKPSDPSRPRRYGLDDVLETLDQVYGTLEDLEVVSGARWRVMKS